MDINPWILTYCRQFKAPKGGNELLRHGLGNSDFKEANAALKLRLHIW